jgi:hypothetical protein
MRRIFTAAAVAALAALPACDRAATEPDGPLTGTWRYEAKDFRIAGNTSDLTCSMSTTLVITQTGNELEGEGEESTVTCVNGAGTASGSSFPNGVVLGEVQDGRVHFSDAGAWHSFGEVQPDLVEGYLEAYAGTAGNLETVRSGSFVLTRISHQGYDGPRA